MPGNNHILHFVKLLAYFISFCLYKTKDIFYLLDEQRIVRR